MLETSAGSLAAFFPGHCTYDEAARGVSFEICTSAGVKPWKSEKGVPMKRKGVNYDVGRVMMGEHWRPAFDPKIVHHELEIIKNDLHCNAVRICCLAIDRLMTAAEDALKQGLEVWLSPEMWDKSQEETLDYIVKAAAAAEKLREHWPQQLVFSVGSE